MFQNQFKMKKVIVPFALQEQFLSVARLNVGPNNRHVETLAILGGYEEEDQIVATTLLFPTQHGTASMVTDCGK